MKRKLKLLTALFLCLLILAGTVVPMATCAAAAAEPQNTDLPIIPITPNIPDNPDEPINPDNPGTESDPIQMDLILGTFNSKTFTMDYLSTATFNVVIPSNAVAVWSKDGEFAGFGSSVTVKEMRRGFTLTVNVTAANGAVYTDTETVVVNHSLGDIILGFFRRLFRILPVYVDNQKIS